MKKDAKRIGAYGASGSGKSTRVKELTRVASPRHVVFDPMDEYGREGYVSTRRLTGKHSVLEYIKRGWRRGFKIAYVPTAGKEPEELHKLSVLLAKVQEPYRQNVAIPKLTLIVEELNLSFPVAGLPRNLGGFANLCSRGRHYGIEIIGVSQRVAEISTRFRGNTDTAYFFRQEEYRDIQTIVGSLGPQWKEPLKALQTHEYLKRESGQITRGKNLLAA